MATVYTLYVLALLSITPAMLWLAWYAWKRGRTPVHQILMTLCLMTGILTPAYALLMIDPVHPFFWARIRFIGVAFVPLLFLLFVIAYAGYEKWLEPKRVTLLCVIPVITQAILWLEPRWFYRAWDIRRMDDFNIEIAHYTGWFHIHSAYVVTTFMVTLYLLAQFIRRSDAPYRMQGILLFASGLMPFALGILTTLRLIPRNLPPLTPLGVCVSLVIAAWALFRYKLLEVLPVAYEAIIRNMHDVVIVLDNELQVVGMNPAAERLLNYRLENAVGQSIMVIAPNARTLIEQYRGRLDEDIELTFPNGSVFDLRVSVLHNASRDVIGQLAVMRDITARKRAEQEREQMIRDLEAYTRTVAHDLKNPLNIVRGYAEIMVQNNTLTAEDYRRFAEHIVDGSDKMLEIMESMLLLAQVRSQTEIPTETVDMRTVVQRVLNSLQSQIDRSHAVIHVPETLPVAPGYAPWVELVWVNYISNALKYGGKPPVIQIASEMIDGRVRYQVQDNGAGLTPEQQACVFEPFTRFHNQAEGHGIGLSIVWRIMEKLGGNAGVESTSGSGSRFYFTLPAVALSRESEPEPMNIVPM